MTQTFTSWYFTSNSDVLIGEMKMRFSPGIHLLMLMSINGKCNVISFPVVTTMQ